MASISIDGMTGGVNPNSPLPGALGPSSLHEGGLRAPFFVHTAIIIGPFLQIISGRW